MSDEQEICGLVSQLAWRLQGHVRDRVDGTGLSTSQAVALRELTGPMSLRELSARLCCEPSNTTFVVDHLEAAGLVQRVPHERDRRVKQVVLTAAGRRARADLLTRLGEGSPLAHLSPEDIAALRAALTRVLDSSAG